MRISKLGFMLALVGTITAGSACAETFTNQELISTLGQVAEGAPSIDAALLAEEVAANVGKGSTALPAWSSLAAMPQINVDIEFELNSVVIAPESYRNVGMIADALHDPRLLGHKILIVGHTDSTGDAKDNLKLSQARADAIRDALNTTFAVAPDRLFAVGVGEEMPLNVTDPKAAANRRVQLINVGLLK
ncbi:OmpA family protein [Rhizobium mesoamericanum]|uniref:Putative outer membrane protein (OmpA/MotB domain) n=1 Tax=Rhizobium mesoamericanum STM3625 TaxID=1211777 RepID=K0Q2K0_9HYPH|nr:putative outer membrane protein (OmpA/MotB domain) [Rhizobium mesoamericanum STM3625]